MSMRLPKSPLALSLLLLGAAGCGRTITEPTAIASETNRTSTTSDPSPGPTAIPAGVEWTGPAAPGCQPATERLESVVNVTSAPELVRLYAHAFRDPVAGCENTVHSLAT